MRAVTKRELGIQKLRERTAHRAVKERAANAVRRPCLYGNHDMKEHDDEWKRCSRCGVLQLRGYSLKVPRKVLRLLRDIVEPRLYELPERFTHCVDVLVTPDLIWRRHVNTVPHWSFLVCVTRKHARQWVVAGNAGPSTYDEVLAATRKALAADSADPMLLWTAIRRAVYGEGHETPY